MRVIDMLVIYWLAVNVVWAAFLYRKAGRIDRVRREQAAYWAKIEAAERQAMQRVAARGDTVDYWVVPAGVEGGSVVLGASDRFRATGVVQIESRRN